MTRLLKPAGIAAAAFVLCGCTGSLIVTDDSGAVMQGVPVLRYEAWVESGSYTKLSKGAGECEPMPYHKVVNLPTGKPYYVRAEGSTFAKTTFSMKLSEGALTDLSFNTDSNIPDTLNAAANIMKAMPSIGITGTKTGGPSEKPACDAGEDPKKLQRLEKWLLEHD